ncbi:MAG: Rrf2 family transcriptional regulator [Lentisphaeria bacterium]|nr:Rrf2 family transcriptional regulator [Lentisphaeria bacterium]
MILSQKAQYALRAIYELALHHGEGPVKISDIAGAQDIPHKFLELILHELKQAGFVMSKRGKAGGYLLIRSPGELSVGEILRYVQGPLGPVSCLSTDGETGQCRLRGHCVFLPMWERVEQAVSEIYDKTTFQDLLLEDRRQSGLSEAAYQI